MFQRGLKNETGRSQEAFQIFLYLLFIKLVHVGPVVVGSFPLEKDVVPEVSGSCTHGTAGHRLWPNKSGYDHVPSSGKWLRNKYLISNTVPLLLAEGQGPPT
jgi:hypothetical protein